MTQYYEDFSSGQVNRSRSRTITEADIVNFAGLSGDFIELHMSDTFAAGGPFGRRIAHGALIFSISTGLFVQMLPISDTVIAFYGLDHLRFTKPVFAGDTIYLTKKVTRKEERGPERGLVSFETTVFNQRDEPVLVYSDKLLLKRRPA